MEALELRTHVTAQFFDHWYLPTTVALDRLNWTSVD